MNGRCASGTGNAVGLPTAAEREVADLLALEADPAEARAVLDSVSFWFHTFALNRAAGLYTPGVARDHRYRIPALPACFDGLCVLDVGTFDGFYAFLAEARGAQRVIAIDNEQYRLWVRARWGVDLAVARAFRRSTACWARPSGTGAWTPSSCTARRALRRGPARC